MTKPDLTLYHAPMSRSVRVRWLLEEMGVSHKVENLGPVSQQARGNMGGETYKQIHPLQKIPALKDGDQIMFESLAINEYIATRYGPTQLIVNSDETDYARYLEWNQFGEASMAMPVNMVMAHTVLLPEHKRSPAIASWSAAMNKSLLQLLDERGLDNGKREFLAGDRLTLADMSVAYMLFLLKITRNFADAPETVRVCFDRIRALPSWQRASAD